MHKRKKVYNSGQKGVSAQKEKEPVKKIKAKPLHRRIKEGERTLKKLEVRHLWTRKRD